MYWWPPHQFKTAAWLATPKKSDLIRTPNHHQNKGLVASPNEIFTAYSPLAPHPKKHKNICRAFVREFGHMECFLEIYTILCALVDANVPIKRIFMSYHWEVFQWKLLQRWTLMLLQWPSDTPWTLCAFTFDHRFVFNCEMRLCTLNFSLIL